jgi:hypothetical protein
MRIASLFLCSQARACIRSFNLKRLSGVVEEDLSADKWCRCTGLITAITTSVYGRNNGESLEFAE